MPAMTYQLGEIAVPRALLSIASQPYSDTQLRHSDTILSNVN
jgi:hypothetical protein